VNVERLFIYLFIYCNFYMYASMILQMGLQTAEQSLIQKAPTPKNSGQHFLYCITFCFNNTVGLTCFLSDWNNEFSTVLVKVYVRL
jgi:hypothetical protein